MKITKQIRNLLTTSTRRRKVLKYPISLHNYTHSPSENFHEFASDAPMCDHLVESRPCTNELYYEKYVLQWSEWSHCYLTHYLEFDVASNEDLRNGAFYQTYYDSESQQNNRYKPKKVASVGIESECGLGLKERYVECVISSSKKPVSLEFCIKELTTHHLNLKYSYFNKSQTLNGEDDLQNVFTSVQKRACLAPCAQDCIVSVWSDWSTCSSSCHIGHLTGSFINGNFCNIFLDVNNLINVINSFFSSQISRKKV